MIKFQLFYSTLGVRASVKQKARFAHIGVYGHRGSRGTNRDQTVRLFQKLPEADTEEALEKLLPWNMTGIPSYKIETGKI